MFNFLRSRIHRNLRSVAALAFAVAVSIGVSCAGNLPQSNLSPEIDGRPRETPVPLQPTQANKGQRCAHKSFSDVGQDDDYDPFCYELQSRLAKAAYGGKLDEMRAALRDGANVDASAFDVYYHPLHTAAMVGQVDAVRLLLDNGADVDQGDFISGTALTVAAINGHEAVVRVLLQRGADACVKIDGGTAKVFAQKEGHKEIVVLLDAAEQSNCKSGG